MKFSICIPVYNGEITILDSLKSALNQNFNHDYKVHIVDNNSSDNTLLICEKLNNTKVFIHKFDITVPAGENFQRCIDICDTTYLIYLSSDDILDSNCLNRYKNFLDMNKNLSIISRTYYWFEDDTNIPTRATNQLEKHTNINIKSNHNDLLNFIDSTCQLSGLLIEKSKIKNKIKSKPFVELPSIVLPILKTNEAIHLKYNSVAVRTSSSGANLKKTYDISAALSWYDLFQENFLEYKDLLNFLINNYISKNYESLVQIKINGGYIKFIKEVYFFIKINNKILLDPKFDIYILILHLPNNILEKIKIFYKKIKVNDVSLNNLIE